MNKDSYVDESKGSIAPYEEEESYENPNNISKAPGCQEDYIDIRSEFVPQEQEVNLSILSMDQAYLSEANSVRE